MHISWLVSGRVLYVAYATTTQVASLYATFSAICGFLTGTQPHNRIQVILDCKGNTGNLTQGTPIAPKFDLQDYFSHPNIEQTYVICSDITRIFIEYTTTPAQQTRFHFCSTFEDAIQSLPVANIPNPPHS